MSMAEEKTVRKSPLWDSAISLEKRLDYLLEQLTLEEKFQCLGTGCPKIERLGIEEFYVGGEGAHGVQARHDQSFDRGEPQPTTILPNPIGMSATWDTDLIREAGRVVGNEARAVFSKEKRGGLCLWAPTVDMERDPRWGRTEEGYGEDPYLAGKMSSAYIQGMRGNDPFYIRCGATLKHFYGNNVEEGRVWKSSSIDPRNKYEYYLEPFRRAVVEGGAEAMMTAYNEINGIPCLLNHEVQYIAKEQWGIHHVVCDGGDMKQTVECHRYFGSHAETIAAGLKAGLDCFTDDIEDVVAGAREAYENGMITTEDIDRALRCHFGTMIRLGLFDGVTKNPYAEIGEEELNTLENQQIAYEMTKESIVLLKNEPSENSQKPLLPLEQQQFAIIGPLADVWYKDWYSGIPPYHVTPLEGIRRCIEAAEDQPKEVIAGAGHKKLTGLAFEAGLPQIKLVCGDRYLGLLEDGKTIGLVTPEQAEIFEITLWDKKQATLRSVSTGKLLTTENGRDEEKNYRPGIVTASRDEAFGWFVKEVFHISWEGDSFYAALRNGTEFHLQAWNDAEYFVDRMGRLRVPEQEGFIENGVAVKGCGRDYQKISNLRPVLVRDGLQEAVGRAAESETVIFMAGANPMINCKEEADRQDIDLPLYQQELIRAVYQVNRKMVLVLVSSIPFGITWEQEHIPAIVTMASGSMELGNALADVLFGHASPSGRLNMTWYRDTSELPDMDDYDIIQKERTYQYFQGEVLYPFGHGLTYSPVRYSNLQVKLCDRTVLKVTLQIANEGQYRTDEVVQIYVTKKDSVVKRALCQLKGFERIKGLLPGQTGKVCIEIPVADLQYYDVVARQMLLEPGEYEIMAGASSKDIRLRESITLKGTRRGFRDGMGWNPADHYDRSEQAGLWEGHMGYPCVENVFTACEERKRGLCLPERNDCQTGENMLLVYDAVFLEAQPEELVLDAQLAKGARVFVYLDEKPVGEYTKRQDGRETEIVISEGWAAGTGGGNSRHGDGFEEIRIPVTRVPERKEEPENKNAAGSVFRLKLLCCGSVKICRWKFR